MMRNQQTVNYGNISHRFSLGLEVLQEARKVGDDLRRQVLRDDLVLTRVVVQLVEGRQEGSTEGVPAGATGSDVRVAEGRK